MSREMEFEASIKTGITPDVEYIRQNDEIVKEELKESGKNNPMYFIGFLLAAVVFFFINKIVMVICALIGIAALLLYIRTAKYIKMLRNEDYLKEIYEEGLLTAGLIVKTEPLTVMTITDLRASDECEEQYACYVLQAERLQGAAGTLYEKIPCASLFRYEGGDYHSAYMPHPLYWGTGNQDEIRAAIRRLDEEQEEDGVNMWEVIKKTAAAFTDLKPGELLQLDASFTPLGRKQYLDSNFVPVVTEQVRSRYPKNYPDIPHITEDIPAASVYNKMIDLAVECRVYEYVATHCKERDYAPLSNPGYFTYIGDPFTFLEAFGDRNITLAEGEYPLIAGIMLLTTKGCWRKKEFIPWQDMTLDAETSSLGEIETMVNGKAIVSFKHNLKYYLNNEAFTKEDIKVVKEMEVDGIRRFLQGLREMFDN